MRKNNKFICAVSIMLAVCIALGLAACAPAQSPAAQVSSTVPAPATSAAPAPATSNKSADVPTVKVGFLYTMSGASADYGKQDLDAANLAVEDWNNNGGIKSLGGAKLELVVADSTSDPAQSKNACERLLSDKEIVGLVGCGISAVTLPVLPVTEKLEVPIVTICTSPDITSQGYKYVFKVAPDASGLGQTQVEMLKWLNTEKNYGVTKVGIIYENSSWGINSAKGSRTLAEKAGLEIVYDESFPAGITDASAIVTALKASGAEAVMPTAYIPEAKLLVQTMNSLDYHPLFLGSGGAGYPEFAKALGDSVNGILYTGQWNLDSKYGMDNSALTKKFKDKFGYFMTEHAGPTYVCYDILFRAIEKAASRDPKAIREVLATTTFENVAYQPGKVEFDDRGQNIHSFYIMTQWQGGIPTTIYPMPVAANEFTEPDKLK